MNIVVQSGIDLSILNDFLAGQIKDMQKNLASNGNVKYMFVDVDIDS